MSSLLISLILCNLWADLIYVGEYSFSLLLLFDIINLLTFLKDGKGLKVLLKAFLSWFIL